MDKCMAADSVDPDVSGIGVVVAFLVYPFLALGIITCAWFKNAIPGLGRQPMDLYLKQRICRFFLRRDYSNTPARPEVVAAFGSLLANMSDPLLFGGLAILIAAYAKADITEHSFRFAAALAGLSSSAYLVTLAVLPNHGGQPRKMKYFRAFLMLLQGGLHLASRLRETTATPQLWRKMFCGHRSPVQLSDGVVFGVWFFLSYAEGMVNIFAQRGGSPSKTSLIATFVSFFARPNVRRASNLDLLKGRLAKGTDTFEWVRLFVYSELYESLIWDIAWLAGGCLYGLRNIVTMWYLCAEPEGGPETCWKPALSMGFGQIVPLVSLLYLLASCLSAYESGSKGQHPLNSSISSNAASGHQLQPCGSSAVTRTYIFTSHDSDKSFIQNGGDPYETRIVEDEVQVFFSIGLIPLVMISGVSTSLANMLADYVLGYFAMLLYGSIIYVDQICRYL